MGRIGNRCGWHWPTTIKLWVPDAISSKGTPFILCSNQIRSFFEQVNTEDIESWPQPWKSMHIRYHYGDHRCESDSNDLYGSDDYKTYYEEEDSFESQVIPRTSCTSIDSW